MKIKKLITFLLAFAMIISLFPLGPSSVKAVGELNPPTQDDNGNLVFNYQGDESTETVWLAGEMNGWGQNDQSFPLTEGENKLFTLVLEPGTLDPGTYEFKYIVNGEWTGGDNLSFEALAPVNYANTIPTTDSDGNTTFTYYGDENTEAVYLVGGMNGWTPEDPEMLMTRGDHNAFTITLDETRLELGTEYEYKYFIDGDWLGGDNLVYTTPGEKPEPVAYTNVTIHFDNPEDYDWALHVWPYRPSSLGGTDYEFDSRDDFGQVANIRIPGLHTELGFLVKDADWNKEYEQDRFITVIGGEAEIWLKAGDETVYYENPDLEPASFEEVSARVHYHRYISSQLKGWSLLAWTNEQEESQAKLVEMTDEKEGLIVGEFTLTGQDISSINLRMVKYDGDQIIDQEEVVNVRRFDENGFAEVWLSQGDTNSYTSENIATISPAISEANLDGLDKIGLIFNRFIDTDVFENGALVKSADSEIIAQSIEFTESPANRVILHLEEDLELTGEYTVELYLDADKELVLTANVSVGNVVADPSFDEAYAYDGELGPIYSPASTEFKVWAPTARNVNLLIFNGDQVEETFEMQRNDRGVYSYTLEGDQDKTVYMYEVDLGDKVNRSVDPYAKSVTINGQRSVVVNPVASSVARPDSSKVNRPVIWELHVRDLSNQIESGIEHRGQFLGLTEEGTTTPSGQVTGLDYIKTLGVTHVQLLPIYDFGQASVDERDPLGRFNWGYDPVNYNAPEGAYSTDPTDPYARINELQTAIDTLHENGLGVIMDVVYNHVFSVGEHAFDKIVPGYYFRYDENGNLRNGTGVGNETASERAMMRKFMVDSLKYWTETYNLDGFRFDLMGIHDTETMQLVYDELVKINPDIFILGEGWTMGSHERGAIPSDQVHANQIPNIAMFNDHLRDLAKGSVFNNTEPGFVNGAEGTEEELMKSIKTGPNVAGKNYDNPRQFIQYVEAHDNLTLWDKLTFTNPEDSQEDLLKRHKIATAIPLLSQGVPFIHAGQEFARTKDGNHNSYNASAELNELDWARVEEFSDNVEYVRQLIAIRNAEDLFWMDSFEEINSKFQELVAADKLIAYRLHDDVNNYYIGHNSSDEEQTIEGLENGTYLVLVRDQEADLNGLDQVEITDGTITIEGLSTLVLKALVEETDPEDPADPVEPTDPTDPADPEDPVDPTEPTDPSDSDKPGKDDDVVSGDVIPGDSSGQKPGTSQPGQESPGSSPKTGDEFPTLLIGGIALIAGLGLAITIIKKKDTK